MYLEHMIRGFFFGEFAEENFHIFFLFFFFFLHMNSLEFAWQSGNVLMSVVRCPHALLKIKRSPLELGNQYHRFRRPKRK